MGDTTLTKMLSKASAESAQIAGHTSLKVLRLEVRDVVPACARAKGRKPCRSAAQLCAF